jgi:hypothetical protein
VIVGNDEMGVGSSHLSLAHPLRLTASTLEGPIGRSFNQILLRWYNACKPTMGPRMKAVNASRCAPQNRNVHVREHCSGSKPFHINPVKGQKSYLADFQPDVTVG